MKKERIEKINDFLSDSMPGHLGIKITDIGENFITGKMPVNSKTAQPFGLLHGGASAAFAETLGSTGSFALIDKEQFYPVGIEVSASHIRKASESYVYGEAKLLKKSKKLHIWDIKIFNAQGELICLARHSVLLLKKKLP